MATSTFKTRNVARVTVLLDSTALDDYQKSRLHSSTDPSSEKHNSPAPIALGMKFMLAPWHLRCWGTCALPTPPAFLWLLTSVMLASSSRTAGLHQAQGLWRLFAPVCSIWNAFPSSVFIIWASPPMLSPQSFLPFLPSWQNNNPTTTTPKTSTS